MKCGDCNHFFFDEFYSEDDYGFVPLCDLGKHWEIESFSEETEACENFLEEKQWMNT